MQTLKNAAFWQILVVLFLLAAVAHVPGQTEAVRQDKPQAILFASWSESQSTANQSRSRFAADKLVVKENFKLAANSFEREAFELINAVRRKANLPALVFDAEMFVLARKHSETMANSGRFSHRGATNETVDERARSAGITDWQGIGENIASNQNAENPVAAALECWLNSEGHRRNFLSRDWTRSAIGVAVAPDGKFYFTQVFRD